MRNNNSVAGTSGMIASAATASALAQGSPNTERYLSETLPSKIQQNTGWDALTEMWVWVCGALLLAGFNYWVFNSMVNETMWPFFAETAFLYLPVISVAIPFAYALTGIPISREHMNVQWQARFFEPGCRDWYNVAACSGGFMGLLGFLVRAAIYIPVFLPLFVAQDIVELLKTVLTGGKHKFRNSRGHFYCRQRKHYRAILAAKGIRAAEQFLIDTSINMHTPRNNQKISMNQWINGQRAKIMGPLENRYGPLHPDNIAYRSAATPKRKSATTGNLKKQKITTTERDIKVKPVKF